MPPTRGSMSPDGGTLTVRPANQGSPADLQAVFSGRGDPHRCQCQWFKASREQWRAMPQEERAYRLQQQANCGSPEAETTSGLLAYLDAEPVGWCAVEPRAACVSYALARAAVGFARERGARALEGYPMLTEPGKDVAWGELFVGSRSIFAAAGFAEVSHPTPRRMVMRIDFDKPAPRLPGAGGVSA